ncbi:MAG: PorT family protein [Candidatus Aminicenantes bacterium]|nr:MAG: PorT family protein [Candidatus Aminicenantes bacterium]
MAKKKEKKPGGEKIPGKPLKGNILQQKFIRRCFLIICLFNLFSGLIYGDYVWISTGLSTNYPDAGNVYNLELDGSTGTIYAGTAKGVYMLNGPNVWNRTGQFYCRDLLITGDNKIYAASRGKIYKFVNIDDWDECGPDLSNTEDWNYYQYIRALTELDGDIYAGTLRNVDHTEHGLVYKLPHNTNSWNLTAGGDGIMPVRDLLTIIPDTAASPNSIIAATQSGVYHYKVNLDKWIEKNDGLQGNALRVNTLEYHIPSAWVNFLYAGTDNGLYRNVIDVGYSWEDISGALDDRKINSLLIFDSDPDDYSVYLVFAGTDNGVAKYEIDTSEMEGGFKYCGKVGRLKEDEVGKDYEVTALLGTDDYIYAGTSKGEVFKCRIQNDIQPYFLGFGIKAGLNFANLNSSGSLPPEFDWTNRTSFCAGAYLSIKLSDYFTVQPVVLFSRKGLKVEQATTSTFNLDFIEIPLLLKFTLSRGGLISPCLCVGPFAAFKLNDNITTGVGVPPIKKFDYGIAFGGGFDIKLGGNTLELKTLYTMGLKNIADVQAGSNITVKSKVLSFMIGLEF